METIMELPVLQITDIPRPIREKKTLNPKCTVVTKNGPCKSHAKTGETLCASHLRQAQMPSIATKNPKCSATTKDGPCKAYAKTGETMCVSHLRQAQGPALRVCKAIRKVDGEPCKAKAIEGCDFCGRHSNPNTKAGPTFTPCSATTKEGNPCKSYAKAGHTLCSSHLRAKPQPSHTLCSKITKEGNPCKSYAKAGETLCATHLRFE